jgi:cephalosporin hydroxylase
MTALPPDVTASLPPDLPVNPDVDPRHYQHVAELARADKSKIVEDFHKLYYYDRLWTQVSWMGVPILKSPMDLWIYQELLYELKPDWIIETGTYNGGSALYLAHLCTVMSKGHVLSIDIEPQANLPRHARLRYLKGDTLSPSILDTVKTTVKDAKTVLVILDSNHTCDHVLGELREYGPLVTPGSYVVVEDGNMNGRPVFSDYPPDQGPGPGEAIDAFLKESNDFTIDPSREKLLLTMNPRGYLKKHLS